MSCVSPAIIIDKPKSILQRVQYIEYLLSLFLRKAFASLKSIYITPGAFSAYRKSFFGKHGGFDEGNVTEDLEMALRIQYKGYNTENCPEGPAYTIAPRKFGELMVQRRRWYFGLLINLRNYRKIMGKKYGDLGTFVIPIAIVSIFFSVFVVLYFSGSGGWSLYFTQYSRKQSSGDNKKIRNIYKFQSNFHE